MRLGEEESEVGQKDKYQGQQTQHDKAVPRQKEDRDANRIDEQEHW